MTDLVASILARLKNLAHENGIIYNDVLQRYATECILRRIEKSHYSSQCILKGGTLFVLWRPGFDYRPTMDIDLEFRGEVPSGGLIHMFQDIAAISGEEIDGLRLDAKTIRMQDIRQDDPYGGLRLTLIAYLGHVRLPIQFDVGIGDAVTPRAHKEAFPTLLDMESPRILVYPRETVVAEKFETIVKRGVANSRMKDYYDLYVLCNDKKLDREIVVTAIRRTFVRRGTLMPEGTPEGLSDDFARNPIKEAQWKSFLRKNRLLVGERSLRDIVHELRDFFHDLINTSH